MSTQLENETRAFIDAVQLLEDAGWLVVRPDSKLLRQSDTRIEGGGEYVEVGTFIAASEHGVGVTWGDLGPLGSGDKLYARNVLSAPPANKSPTPEHVEGDVLSVGEMEVVGWRWRARVSGGAWDAWERGRFGQEIPPFMEVEEQGLVTLTSATTRIQRAERERDAMTEAANSYAHQAARMAINLTKAEAQLADAVKVLEPFSALLDEGWASSHADHVPLTVVWDPDHVGGKRVPVRHFRAARAFLSTIGEKPDAE